MKRGLKKITNAFKGEIKAWKKDLGSEMKENMKLEKKIEAFEKELEKLETSKRFLDRQVKLAFQLLRSLIILFQPAHLRLPLLAS